MLAQVAAGNLEAELGGGETVLPPYAYGEKVEIRIYVEIVVALQLGEELLGRHAAVHEGGQLSVLVRIQESLHSHVAPDVG